MVILPEQVPQGCGGEGSEVDSYFHWRFGPARQRRVLGQGEIVTFGAVRPDSHHWPSGGPAG